ncbi:MAG: DUF5658 family protein [Pyrinomonadaceae bacterium]
MTPLLQCLLLFFLNWLDAQLTIIWVRANLATEGNGLMARLLDMGDAPFLGVKLLVGAFAALLLYRFAHLPIARRGLKLTLGVYGTLMLVHAATGLNALGWHTAETVLAHLGNLQITVFALFI